ncbi:MAG: hypothetical protein Q9216_003809 [Gyalolechia sp. 2 TL-2023]
MEGHTIQSDRRSHDDFAHQKTGKNDTGLTDIMRDLNPSLANVTGHSATLLIPQIIVSDYDEASSPRGHQESLQGQEKTRNLKHLPSSLPDDDGPQSKKRRRSDQKNPSHATTITQQPTTQSSINVEAQIANNRAWQDPVSVEEMFEAGVPWPPTKKMSRAQFSLWKNYWEMHRNLRYWVNSTVAPGNLRHSYRFQKRAIVKAMNQLVDDAEAAYANA